MASVKAKRVWTAAHVRCATSFTGQTPWLIESTVSTNIRVFHKPRSHRLSFVGAPSLAWKAESLKTILSSSYGSISGWNAVSEALAPAQSQSITTPPLLEQQTELTTDNPTMIGFPLAANLVPTPPFAHGREQFNAGAIDDSPERGRSPAFVGPAPMRGPEAKQPCPLGQGRKQFSPISAQPPIKRPIPDAFEGKEQSNGDNFARPQVGHGMFGDVGHRFLYPMEQLAEKILGRHVVLSWRCTGVVTGSLESAHDVFQGPLKLAPLVSIDISASGKVGIRTASPTADLHVAGATTTTVLNQDAFVGMGPDPSSNCTMNVEYGGFSFGAGKGFINVRACTGGTPDLRLMVATTTKVIGDSAGINVLGTIRSNGTTLTVPDYVFETDYKLMPLPELAAYVEKEKHLPEIPPAHEIKKQGLDLGAMQMQLLRKVEELTLHTIAQDKKVSTALDQNQVFKAENAELHNRLTTLEERLNRLSR